MSKLFLKLLVLIFVFNIGATERKIISSSPSYFLKYVYVGKEVDMPLTGDFVVSINPTLTKENKYLIPMNLQETIMELKKILPVWYLKALKKSKGENECSVNVNHVSYSTFIDS